MNWQEVIEHPSLRNLPFKIELNEYGKIEMSPATNWHGIMQGKIFSLLEKLAPEGEVYFECSVQTRKGVKVADVAWASKDFYKQHGVETPLKSAPEICVEVRSPSNSNAEMLEKIDLYLAKGAQEVWICDEDGNIKIYNYEGLILSSNIISKFPQQVLLKK